MSQTLEDYKADLRAPLFDADERKMLDRYDAEQRKRIEDERREKLLEPLLRLIETVVNVMDGRDAQLLGKMLARRMHRTLIQSFVRDVVVSLLKTLVEDGDQGFVDARNQDAYEFAKKSLEANKDAYLRLI